MANRRHQQLSLKEAKRRTAILDIFEDAQKRPEKRAYEVEEDLKWTDVVLDDWTGVW